MENCHGAGARFAHVLERRLNRQGLEVVRAIKGALDPRGAMNPENRGFEMRASFGYRREG
ncbi:MAG: FAD-linked oxidase C-terminal domain-containing protein [Dehalococcoidia bacterium]